MRISIDGGKEMREKPGPGVYDSNPDSILRVSPRFAIGTSKRGDPSRMSVPGPGSYLSKTFTGEEGSKFSMRKTLDWEPHFKE